MFFFPTCPVRVSDFIRVTSSFLPSFLLTPTANSRSQWALLDLNSELQISVGTAGPQPDARKNVR